MADASAQRSRNAIFWLLLLVLTLFVVVLAVYFYSRETDPVVLAEAKKSPQSALIDDAAALKTSFKRMLSLGYNAYDINIGAGTTGDMQAENGLMPKIQLDASEFVTSDAAWQIGGGQIVGDYDNKAPDIVFFIQGLNKSVCQGINAALWQDDPKAEPVASGVPNAAWARRAANLLELFNGKNRSESCVMTDEGIFVYYILAYKGVVAAE